MYNSSYVTPKHIHIQIYQLFICYILTFHIHTQLISSQIHITEFINHSSIISIITTIPNISNQNHFHPNTSKSSTLISSHVICEFAIPNFIHKQPRVITNRGVVNCSFCQMCALHLYNTNLMCETPKIKIIANLM